PFTIQLDANGEATITSADIDGGSMASCGSVSLAIDITNFTCTDIGENTVTLTVTDGNGNTSTCTTIVTVEDNVAPEALCAAPFAIQLDANGEASITAADIDNSSSDSCGIDTVTISQTDFDCSHVGENTITLTVTDVNGNTSTCTTIVTVEDNIAPEAICVAPFTIQLDANGQASITAADIDNSSSDSCGIDTLTISQTDFNCSHVGENTIILTITDENGNTSTSTTIVTVEDNVAPEVLCVAPFTIQLDINGEASITVGDIDNGSSDVCGMDTLTISQTDFDCSHIGDNTITLTVTDVNGNTSTCTTIVTVEDNVAPEALCVAPFTIQLDINGEASITVADIDNGSSDACGIASITISPSSFDCSDLGENTVVLTVIDFNGNESTCSTVVSVEGASAPVVTCTDLTLELGPNGTAVLTPEDIGSFLADCGTLVTAIDMEFFDCSHIGNSILVTYFATDGAGNNVSCTAMVTVVDTLGPVIDCPLDQTVDSDPNSITYTLPDYFGEGIVIATDNCTEPVTIFSQSPASGTLLLDGTYTITLTATDAFGNDSVCTFELTVDTILGAGEIHLDFSSLTLYPNPAEYSVTIGIPKFMAIDNIYVYDIQGRLVLSKNTGGATGNQTLDVGHLASSVYMVVIESNGKQAVKQLIKK
ncbi:MAG: T9SS type A sorting domain-containing protein, partial [Flavobacteriales bacterium]|nr:T9SS type A sorting domain-containing protein [Flavobacteriales bacterium]